MAAGSGFLESAQPPPRPLTAIPSANPFSDAEPAPRYEPAGDLRWLLLRPWIWISRLLVVSWQLGRLAITLAAQANSTDPQVQQRLARRILTTLSDLGPCFIKVGQALSTRPDLVRRD